ncbi:sensor histidine kinase inhibitor, KipI family [Halopseudomonas xinjiangensis]|uniref:Sensor histidine kinase inhibitor, KipI family n=1 Tax=Halopseudomonas xinjiangensis TaxID=487184 RepID=A0A1H1Y3R7_9GAMM|nr:5-oxoprolinase subunit PxpB [Halopseudomonas xinjiangensis]SDT15656.1 sensor histidine kinase inhibitor, KipI family [Halopseudomonas xinjiangensis]
MRPRVETAALDSLTLRLFDSIDESNMPWLLAAAERVRSTFGLALVDLVPSYTTLMITFDPAHLDEREARSLVGSALAGLQPLDAQRTGALHDIPVWYDPSVGPDLAALGKRSGMGEAALIRAHCAREYSVFALGFAPGFAYMGLVEPQIAAPRLATPRQRVPAGSVGIAERQTAIYPLISPGGWNLLGRSPIRLFDRDRDAYSLLAPGDRVRFVAVDHAEFVRLGGDDMSMAGS